VPCDQIRVVSVEFRAENHKLLDKAAKNLGLQVVSQGVLRTPEGNTIRLLGDTAECLPEDQHYVASLRVEYAQTMIKDVASKLAWRVNIKGKNKMTVSKGL
jgi:hypothetical protein